MFETCMVFIKWRKIYTHKLVFADKLLHDMKDQTPNKYKNHEIEEKIEEVKQDKYPENNVKAEASPASVFL